MRIDCIARRHAWRALAIAAVVSLDTIAAENSVFFVNGDGLLYLDNTEYNNAYAEGRTFLGGNAQVRVGYRPAKGLTFRLGAHVRRDAGDGGFLSDARLLVSGTVQRGPMTLTMGEIDGRRQHELPDMLFAPQRRFDPAVEEGAQVLLRWRRFQQEIWVDWRGLNTPSQREHFVAGSVSQLTWGPLCVPVAALVEHHGGEQYAPEGQAVRQVASGYAAVRLVWPLKVRLDEVGVEVAGLLSAADHDRSDSYGYTTGGGGRAEAWIKPYGVLLSLAFYRGQDFECWNGNPLYQTDRPYYSLTVTRQFSLARAVKLDVGLKAECVDRTPGEYFEASENQVWLTLSYNLRDHFFGQRASKTKSSATDRDEAPAAQDPGAPSPE
jgi:hypothetical protein